MLKILYIDDDSFEHDIVLHYCKHLSVEMHSASSVSEGKFVFKAQARKPFDLIICDIRGVSIISEACDFIKSLQDLGKPVWAVSGQFGEHITLPEGSTFFEKQKLKEALTKWALSQKRK